MHVQIGTRYFYTCNYDNGYFFYHKNEITGFSKRLDLKEYCLCAGQTTHTII